MDSDFISENWKNLGKDPGLLVHSRHQLHQAVQLVAAVGRNYHLPEKDDPFGNFEWLPDINGLAGWEVDTSSGKIKCALNFVNFNLQFLVDGIPELSIPLDGKLDQTILQEMQNALDSLGLNGSKLDLNKPYKIPEYKIGPSEAYASNPKEYKEFSKYFSNANAVLKALAANLEGASDVKCWPHHFDIATLITLTDTGDTETSSSIGVGLSPGDESYQEPYFYITPWPYPDLKITRLPKLSVGHWHTEGFVAAILTGSTILQGGGSANNQIKAVSTFLEEGLDHTRKLTAS